MVGAVAPLSRLATVQLTETLPTWVQTQPVPAAETKVTPAGSVSLTATATAVDGPALATTSWYVTLPSAAMVGGPDFTSDRSAAAPTLVTRVEVLFAGTGSAVALETVAVLVR